MTVITVTDIKKRYVTAITQQITTVTTGTLVKQRPYPQVHPLNCHMHLQVCMLSESPALTH